ncbi:MAG: sensor histidine kinase [Dermatophilaceae bacterium]
MTLDSILRHIRRPELASTGEQRLRAYLAINLAAIFLAVVGLSLARVSGLDSPQLRVTLWVLLGAGALIGSGLWLSARDLTDQAAALVVVATWTVAIVTTWVSPFIAPVALLILLIPLVIVADNLPARMRAPMVTTTMVVSGLLIALGELGRADFVDTDSARALRALLAGLFVPLTVGVIALGLRDYARRLWDRTRELEESRSRLVAAAVEARRSIERDLHDGAQQRLAALAVQVGRATRLCETDPDQAKAIVGGLQAHLDAAIKDLRDLAHGIYPTLLADRGLSGALPAAARRTTLPCTIDTAGVARYNPDAEAAVYFGCLEAMQNADRHSHGTVIRVTVWEGARRTIRFRVADDGVGFAVSPAPNAHGLTGMRDRVRAAGGELTVQSSSRGTVVDGVVPNRGSRLPDIRVAPGAGSDTRSARRARSRQAIRR